jgi:hypothetical protein
MVRSDDCQLRTGRKWKTLSVKDALQIPKRDRWLRCPKCHAPVWPHKRGKNGAAPHFQHFELNPKCPRRHGAPLIRPHK